MSFLFQKWKGETTTTATTTMTNTGTRDDDSSSKNLPAILVMIFSGNSTTDSALVSKRSGLCMLLALTKLGNRQRTAEGREKGVTEKISVDSCSQST